MGGDGLYMEILHGLTLRKQEEEGVDYNDPDAKLIPPTVRVGIIPAGKVVHIYLQCFTLGIALFDDSKLQL